MFVTRTLHEWETFLDSQPDIAWSRVQTHQEVRREGPLL